MPTNQSIQKTVEVLEVPPFVDKVADMAVVVKGRRMRYRRARNPEAHTGVVHRKIVDVPVTMPHQVHDRRL